MSEQVAESTGMPTRERRGKSPVGKAERLFRRSAFAMVIIAVYVIFGGLYHARTLYGGSPTTLKAYNALLLKQLSGGILILQVGILLALYGLLARLFSTRPATYKQKRSERFLKLSSLTFTAGAAAVLIGIMVLHGRRITMAAKVINTVVVKRMVESAEAIQLQSHGVASFFLLLAMFSLVLLGLGWQDRRA